ncbi:hypothetical protein B0I37DRAFT_217355 [Chaetomium sp. MPI-CAGE-AT-0009]|nr:hypothetical protein B0I37DRAFT_217355 [Chaetomium sp. MPI-CAGE-AT-0009]
MKEFISATPASLRASVTLLAPFGLYLTPFASALPGSSTRLYATRGRQMWPSIAHSISRLGRYETFRIRRITGGPVLTLMKWKLMKPRRKRRWH